MEQSTFIVIKRALSLTVFTFTFQYLLLSTYPYTLPAPPLYPPIGFAFSALFLFGDLALLGLGLATFCALSLRGFNIYSLSLTSLADLGIAWIGVRMTQALFSSDVRLLREKNEWITFIFVIALLIAPLSGWIHILPYRTTLSLNLFTTIWLSDLNALLIIPFFVLSFAHVPASRETVFYPLNTATLLFSLGYILSLASIFLFKIPIMVILPILFGFSLLATTQNSYLITLLKLFFNASILLAFSLHQNLDLQRSWLLSAIVFSYTVIALTTAHYQVKKLKPEPHTRHPLAEPLPLLRAD